MKPKEIKELAYSIFKKYNSKSIFENDGNKKTVSKSGINESIEKIFNNKIQRNLLKEHLQVFSDLGDIIENATLVNQTKEAKNRSNINSWNYYFDGLNINNELYHLEFDVRSLDTGENQYRVQRLEKINNKKRSAKLPIQSGNFNTSVANNIPQSNTNVNSDTSTKYSMPINKNDTETELKILKSIINESIKENGTDGRFDTDRNTEELYDQIWSEYEKELGRELTDSDYALINNTL